MQLASCCRSPGPKERRLLLEVLALSFERDAHEMQHNFGDYDTVSVGHFGLATKCGIWILLIIASRSSVQFS